MTIAIVGGALANKPFNGGEAWVRLSWIRGLAALGFDTYLLERIDPACCVGRGGDPAPLADSENRRYFDEVCREFGLEGRAALESEGGARTERSGLSAPEVADLLRDATLLVNVSGHLPIAGGLSRVPYRAYVDLDPGFTQFWAAQGVSGSRLEGHTHYFTVGERIGAPDCPIPTLGLAWRPVRQPVVPEDWPTDDTDGPRRFTTVGSWRGAFGRITHEGTTFGAKAHEFRKLAELPRRVDACFEAALAIDPADEADRRLLATGGWRLVDPAGVAAGPSEFRDYVSGSTAEFSVAQGLYVSTRSGWFSDRSVRYLAAGKPVLIQDTGFAPDLVGEGGVVPFSDLPTAIEGATRVLDDYADHALAARRLAERRFSPSATVGQMLDEMGVAP